MAVAYYGIGDAIAPVKTDVDNLVAQVIGDGYGVHFLEKDTLRIGEIDHVNGVNTVDGNVSITTFAGTIHLGQPVQATNAAASSCGRTRPRPSRSTSATTAATSSTRAGGSRPATGRSS